MSGFYFTTWGKQTAKYNAFTLAWIIVNDFQVEFFFLTIEKIEI